MRLMCLSMCLWLSACGSTSSLQSGVTASSPARNAAVERRVDAIFSQFDQPDAPGCALAVVQSGKIVYERGYGIANLDYRLPITPDTVFYIASTSKQFTAAATALLAEEGKISLDDDLRKYVPEIPAYAVSISVRNLIHHTSGLRDYLSLWEKSGRSFADSISEQAAIDLIARQDGLDFTPGAKYKYSNSNYFLLSVIVKRASGRSLREYADEKIFRPLGMRNTHFHDDRTLIVPNRATAYFKRNPEQGGGLAVYQTSFDLVGDGGLLTTVRDLYLWDQNFYHNVLGARGQGFISQLLSIDPLNDGKPGSYAFGLMLGDHQGLKTVGHDGYFIGYKAGFLRIPEREFAAITLCNASEAIVGDLTRKVADLYLDLTVAAPAIAGSSSVPTRRE